jgi:hypothetical protein
MAQRRVIKLSTLAREVDMEEPKDMRRLRTYCILGKIPGAFKIGRGWFVPRETADNIIKRGLR